MSEDFSNVNYDGNEGEQPVKVRCKNGHEWESYTFLSKDYNLELDEPYCPVCNEIGEAEEK